MVPYSIIISFSFFFLFILLPRCHYNILLNEIKPGNPCLVGEAFLKFLSLLETPVIYDELVKNCIEASESVAKSQQILASFRTVNANVLYYITAFLRDLLKVSGKNRFSVSILGKPMIFVSIATSSCF